MDGDDIEEEIAPVVPVVEISTHGQHREAWGPRNDNQHNADLDSDNDDDDDDSNDEHQPTPTRSTTHTQPHYKSINGKMKIDMTPPDQKLKQSEDLAKKFASAGKADKAIEELIKCVAYSRIVHGASHWRHAQCVANLGEGYLKLKGYYVQAEYHADTARSIMLHGSHMATSMEEKSTLFAVLIQIYRIMGQAATALKKFPEAEQALKKADKISQERSKLPCVTDRECDQLDIELFQSMARLYAKEKKHALASEKYDKVIELMTKEFGTDSPQVMQANTEYGKLEQSKGKYANHDKTIQLFLEAHSIASAIHKEGHPDLIDTALNLSQAYAGTGWEDAEGTWAHVSVFKLMQYTWLNRIRKGSALSYMEECLRSCTTIYGPNHAKTLEVQDHLAKMLIRMDKMTEGLQILQSSLPNKCEIFGDYSEPVADTYKLMGSVHLSEGNIEKALRTYKKCYTIEALLLGKNHRKTKDTLRTMELLLANPGVSHKFVLNKEDKLLKRPRFNNVVGRTK